MTTTATTAAAEQRVTDALAVVVEFVQLVESEMEVYSSRDELRPLVVEALRLGLDPTSNVGQLTLRTLLLLVGGYVDVFYEDDDDGEVTDVMGSIVAHALVQRLVVFGLRWKHGTKEIGEIFNRLLQSMSTARCIDVFGGLLLDVLGEMAVAGTASPPINSQKDPIRAALAEQRMLPYPHAHRLLLGLVAGYVPRTRDGESFLMLNKKKKNFFFFSAEARWAPVDKLVKVLTGFAPWVFDSDSDSDLDLCLDYYRTLIAVAERSSGASSLPTAEVETILVGALHHVRDAPAAVPVIARAISLLLPSMATSVDSVAWDRIVPLAIHLALAGNVHADLMPPLIQLLDAAIAVDATILRGIDTPALFHSVLSFACAAHELDGSTTTNMRIAAAFFHRIAKVQQADKTAESEKRQRRDPSTPSALTSSEGETNSLEFLRLCLTRLQYDTASAGTVTFLRFLIYSS